MSIATLLLAVGYLLAVPMTAIALRIAWRRWVGAFVALLVGNALVVAGWALRGESLPAWMNAGFFVGFVCMWVVVGRIRDRRMPRGQKTYRSD